MEGKNIVIEYRYAEGKPDRLPTLAAELVRLKVDVIVTTGSAVNPSSQGSNFNDSHCHGAGYDPVGNGFVASLARPGGNITGLSTLAPEIGGKQLELLKEIVPRLTRVAVIGTSTNPGNAQMLKEMELAAGALGYSFNTLMWLGPKDIETAFRAAQRAAEAVLVMGGSVLITQRTQIADIAVKSRLPAIYNVVELCGRRAGL